MSHRDVMSGKTRTWPYGTIKTVECTEVTKHCVIVKEGKAGFLLFGSDNDVNPEVGKKYLMEFCAGGTTGGYWKLTKEVA